MLVCKWVERDVHVTHLKSISQRPKCGRKCVCFSFEKKTWKTWPVIYRHEARSEIEKLQMTSAVLLDHSCQQLSHWAIANSIFAILLKVKHRNDERKSIFPINNGLNQHLIPISTDCIRGSSLKHYSWDIKRNNGPTPVWRWPRPTRLHLLQMPPGKWGWKMNRRLPPYEVFYFACHCNCNLLV